MVLKSFIFTRGCEKNRCKTNIIQEINQEFWTLIARNFCRKEISEKYSVHKWTICWIVNSSNIYTVQEGGTPRVTTVWEDKQIKKRSPKAVPREAKIKIPNDASISKIKTRGRANGLTSCKSTKIRFV